MFTINCRDQLLDLSQPVVMGILNVTPDSFFDGGRYTLQTNLLQQVERMLTDGATILDIGGASSRPGAELVSEKDELQRVLPVIESIVKNFPEAILSVDTWRTRVVHESIAAGAALINDISAGKDDRAMYATVADLQVPYILMHRQGDAQTMQLNPVYENVVTEVLDFFIAEVAQLRALGVKDIILDPGFGFGKTVAHNFQLLKNLHVFEAVLGLPVLAGISRKSMICKVLKVNPAQALNGTTALHVIALQQGAKILRVHDVREAVEVISLYERMKNEK